MNLLGSIDQIFFISIGIRASCFLAFLCIKGQLNAYLLLCIFWFFALQLSLFYSSLFDHLGIMILSLIYIDAFRSSADATIGIRKFLFLSLLKLYDSTFFQFLLILKSYTSNLVYHYVCILCFQFDFEAPSSSQFLNFPFFFLDIGEGSESSSCWWWLYWHGGCCCSCWLETRHYSMCLHNLELMQYSYKTNHLLYRMGVPCLDVQRFQFALAQHKRMFL